MADVTIPGPHGPMPAYLATPRARDRMSRQPAMRAAALWPSSARTWREIAQSTAMMVPVC